MATVRKYDKKFFAKANEVKKAHHKIPSMSVSFSYSARAVDFN